jgi:hypothetical protein
MTINEKVEPKYFDSQKVNGADKIADLTATGFAVGGLIMFGEAIIDLSPEITTPIALAVGSIGLLGGIAIGFINRRDRGQASEQN